MSKLQPLKTNQFGLDSHCYRRHSASVDPSLTEEDLVNPDLWASVANKMNIGDEIRIVAEDYSYVAYAMVLFVRGTDVRLKLLVVYDLDEVEQEAMRDPNQDRYIIKQRGTKKWCIVDNSDASIIKEMIPTQIEAQRELADYLKALSR